MHGYNKCFHFSNEFCVWKSNPSAARRQQNGWQGLCLTRCMDTCACVNSCPQIRAICNVSLEEQIWKYISYLVSITHFCCQLSRWDYCNSWENYDNRKVLRENRYLLNASITQWCREQVGGMQAALSAVVHRLIAFPELVLCLCRPRPRLQCCLGKAGRGEAAQTNRGCEYSRAEMQCQDI